MNRLFYFLLFSIVIPLTLSAQIDTVKIELFDIKRQLRRGEIKGLMEISPYFDNYKIIVESLGYHRISTKVSDIAKRIVSENSMFLDTEIDLLDILTTAKVFTNFITTNQDRIFFSPLARAFVITPFADRTTEYQVIPLSNYKKQELTQRKKELLQTSRMDEEMTQLLAEHNPIILQQIASKLLIGRNRFNKSQWNEKEYLDLLQLLTQTTVAVPNEKGKLSYHIDQDYYPDSKINLLIFFSQHYPNYTWDIEQGIFINPQLPITAQHKERELFELLVQENDSLALNAFIQLTTADSKVVANLGERYSGGLTLNENYAIPTFPYRFLNQLTLLTEYCQANEIDFKGSPLLQNRIKSLQVDLSYGDRYALENELIEQLTLEEITAFEYWCLIYEKNYELTYSAGRILNKFYSKNWSALLKNKKHLSLYLKKSALFDELGIIGVCNLYLQKFRNSPPETIDYLRQSKTDNLDIQKQKGKIIVQNQQVKSKTSWETSSDQGYPPIDNFEQEYAELLFNVQDSSKTNQQLIELLARVSYAQIPQAIEARENFRFARRGNRYYFLNSDFGFLDINFNKTAERSFFLQLHNDLTEYQLYAYYLHQSNIDYQDEAQFLDFDKIYDILKYDIKEAFAGGGGGQKDYQVYSIIKLLEIHFQTTLGYSKKRCHYAGINACSILDQAKDWMSFLRKEKHLKQMPLEPPSFQQR